MLRRVASLALTLLIVGTVHAESPAEQLQRFNAYPHAISVSQSERDVVDYEVGLGAIQKIRGVWRFKTSERLSGRLTRFTWQITDGFTSSEVLLQIEAQLDLASLLFSCDGRSCGQGVQWANRVFGERVLYGRDDLQRYRVYKGDGDEDYRLILFSSARTADRQYLHAELLEIASD